MHKPWDADINGGLETAILNYLDREGCTIQPLVSLGVDALLASASVSPEALAKAAEHMWDAGAWYGRCADELFARSQKLQVT